MKKIILWLNDSAYVNPLSPACRQCSKGSKLVLFITGLCSMNCFYCPLSEKKKMKDVIYADEWMLRGEHDTKKIIQEALYIKASGAGITGGDPLLVWRRTRRYIKLLKDYFGDGFNIHLYTSGVVNTMRIPDLVRVGLDEIRFHPPPSEWNNMENTLISDVIKRTVNTGVETTIEIPAIPQMENDIVSLILWADGVGVRYVNLNELEFSETNSEELTKRGYTVKDSLSSAVLGSEKTALNVLNRIRTMDLSVGCHYCSVSFKDGVQLKNRIKRRARSIAKPYEVITDEGTLLIGVITHDSLDKLRGLYGRLIKEYDIPTRFLSFNRFVKQIEVGGWILEEIADDLRAEGYRCYLVEQYPTEDKLEVERVELPLSKGYTK
ncbi:MAG: 4Fe-4S cluster-binding domain-containing protein [Candidatus Thermoplasmatota archaeon]